MVVLGECKGCIYVCSFLFVGIDCIYILYIMKDSNCVIGEGEFGCGWESFSHILVGRVVGVMCLFVLGRLGPVG
jgi:hypothetical protein